MGFAHELFNLILVIDLGLPIKLSLEYEILNLDLIENLLICCLLKDIRLCLYISY